MNKKTISKMGIVSLMLLPFIVQAAPLFSPVVKTESPLSQLQRQLSREGYASHFPASPITNSLHVKNISVKKSPPLPTQIISHRVTEDVLVIDNSGVLTQLTTTSDTPIIAKIPEDIALIETAAASTVQANTSVPAIKNPTSTKLANRASTLPKTAWAIQIGSFKNKENAMRLTHTLRAKGYKAFTRELKSAGLTCVYVGPIPKHNSASLLAEEIKGAINLDEAIITSL